MKKKPLKAKYLLAYNSPNRDDDPSVIIEDTATNLKDAKRAQKAFSYWRIFPIGKEVE